MCLTSARNWHQIFLLQAEALEVAMKDTNMWYGKRIVTRLGRAAGAFVYVCNYY